MKRLVAVCGLAALAACSSPEEMSDGIGVAEDSQTVDVGAAGEGAQAALDRRVAAQAEPGAFAETQGDPDTGSREFIYSWPRQVTAIPALGEALERDLQTQRADQKRSWAQAIADCPEDFSPCRTHTFTLEWQVVADTPRFLSLSSHFSTYTGGAHGHYGRGALIWDREAQQPLEPLQLFVSAPALEEALGESACAKLNLERAKRRGGPVEPDERDWASACVPVEDAALFLGSSNGDAFDRVGVYYGPYVAGAYAEGDFEFTLPVTPAILEAVQPHYRGAFTIGAR